MKTCIKCNIIKEISEFPADLRQPDGVRNSCKACRNSKARSKCYNPSDIKSKECPKCLLYKNIIEFYTCKRYIDGYDIHCKECRCSSMQKTYLNNSDGIKSKTIAYYYNNKEKIQASRRRYAKEKRISDPFYKLKRNIRNRLYYALKNRNWKKDTHFSEYIGCDRNTLISYIEKQFKSDMNWDNYGILWDLDHKLALSNATDEKQIYSLCHYKNLQPLYSNINRNIKKDNNSICWQKLQRDMLIEEDKTLNIPSDIKVGDFIFEKEELSKEHKDFIERYEWLGTVGFSVRHVFTARYKKILGGVVMIAEPNKHQFDIKKEALIQRGACSSWTPKNLGSSLIMFSCKQMVQSTEKRIFVCYADTEAGEIGTIYQACNFKYLGNTFGAKNYYLVKGKKVGERYFTRTDSMKKWAKELNIKWEDSWSKDNGFQNITNIPEDIKKQLYNKAKEEMLKYPKVKAKPKHKYVLCLDKKLNKSIVSLPYPKRT